jgi:hypothetical protein
MENPAAKLSFRLALVIYNALLEEAQSQGRAIGDHVQRILTDYVIKSVLLEEADRLAFNLRISLVDRAVKVAVDIQTVERILRDHIKRSFKACEADDAWLRDYRTFIGGDPFQRDNPRKTSINQEIGMSIRRALGAKVAKRDGKPIKTPVANSIIRSFTELEPSAPETPIQQVNHSRWLSNDR